MSPEEVGQLIFEGRGARELPAYVAAEGSVHAVEPRFGMPLLHLAREHQNLEMIRALVEQVAPH